MLPKLSTTSDPSFFLESCKVGLTHACVVFRSHTRRAGLLEYRSSAMSVDEVIWALVQILCFIYLQVG